MDAPDGMNGHPNGMNGCPGGRNGCHWWNEWVPPVERMGAQVQRMSTSGGMNGHPVVLRVAGGQ